MPANDLVPCYYTGQIRRVERPAELRLRSELHQIRDQELGKFADNGKIFVFKKRQPNRSTQLWDGPLGIGNLLPFFKSQNPMVAPDKLHYTTPMAGDGTTFARHRRHLIRVSGRPARELQPEYAAS